MAITSGQVIVPAGGTLLAQLPPGPASVTVSNGGTALIYVGAGTAIAVTSAMPLPSGGIFTFELFQGNPGTSLRAIAAGGSSTAGFIISTSYGLPQPGQQ